MSPLSNGCNATLFIVVRVGAITNRLRNIASPITTWFGGIDVSPIALRVSDSTITMRVKLVSITISAGAIASTVSIRMITTLWFGLPFGFLLAPDPVRLPRSIEMEPVLPSAPDAPLAPLAPIAPAPLDVGVVAGVGVGVVGAGGDGAAGAVMSGAVIGVTCGGVGAAPAGAYAAASDATTLRIPSASMLPAT